MSGVILGRSLLRLFETLVCSSQSLSVCHSAWLFIAPLLHPSAEKLADSPMYSVERRGCVIPALGHLHRSVKAKQHQKKKHFAGCGGQQRTFGLTAAPCLELEPAC